MTAKILRGRTNERAVREFNDEIYCSKFRWWWLGEGGKVGEHIAAYTIYYLPCRLAPCTATRTHQPTSQQTINNNFNMLRLARSVPFEPGHCVCVRKYARFAVYIVCMACHASQAPHARSSAHNFLARPGTIVRCSVNKQQQQQQSYNIYINNAPKT